MIHSVRTPFLSWFGGITLTLTLIALVASWGNWPSVFLLSTMFGGAGAAMFFMSARVSVDSDGVIIYRVVSTAKVRWSEVERVSEGGGNLVFYTTLAAYRSISSVLGRAGEEPARILACS